MRQLAVHNTRLFPKNLGADRYEITGIAKRCDWVVSTDCQAPRVHVFKQTSGRPRTIFLSLRCHEDALRYFCDVVLPGLTAPFVLVSGSEDVTLPNQTDLRWKPLNAELRACVSTIRDHPLLIRWFVENLDDDADSRMVPLPLGLVLTGEPKIHEVIDIPHVPRLADRPLSVLCGHRVRDGGQWDLRKRVSMLADQRWPDFVTVLNDELSEPDFLAQLSQHMFVICAQGGGQDPSPKAWQALLHGAIPIIKKNALFGAYRRLPVLFVEDWGPHCLSLEILQQARKNLRPYFDDPARRADVLRRLSSDYWWRQVEASIPSWQREQALLA